MGRGNKSSKPMHVALLTPGFPSDENDTACIPALQEYLHGLRRYARDIQATVLTLRYPHRSEAYSWHGLQVFACNGRRLHFPASLLSWTRLLRCFTRLHNRHRVDVLHSLWLGECALL